MSTRSSRFITAAFDHGQVPTIAIINEATTSLGVDLDRLIAALQVFLDRHFIPVWGTPARLVKAKGFLKGAWALAFLDDADVANALGYHDLTDEGLPLSKVFVRTTLADGAKVSVTACHELAEMLVDPAVNLCSTGPKGLLYAYETADPVEEQEFLVNGVPMSDFVYPAWFEEFRKSGSAQFDHMKKVRRPFQILAGGYMPVYRSGKWTEIFGSESKYTRFKKEDRRGHRSTYRGQTEQMKPSRVKGRALGARRRTRIEELVH